MSKLSTRLQSIAQGETYDAAALREAIGHPSVNLEDIETLRLWLGGYSTGELRMRLQDIAIKV